MVRLVHLLGNQTAYRVSVLECVEENLVAPLVELLDLLTLHVGRAGVTELAAETRRRELARDALGDQLDALHYQREVRDRNRSRALGHDVTRESYAAAHLQSAPLDTVIFRWWNDGEFHLAFRVAITRISPHRSETRERCERQTDAQRSSGVIFAVVGCITKIPTSVSDWSVLCRFLLDRTSPRY